MYYVLSLQDIIMEELSEASKADWCLMVIIKSNKTILEKG